MTWHPSDRHFVAAAVESEASDPTGENTPTSCSYCGGTEFKDLTDNGRNSQATCATCGGVMSSWGGQWTPELIGDPGNHPSQAIDPASGAGRANVSTADPLVRDETRYASISAEAPHLPYPAAPHLAAPFLDGPDHAMPHLPGLKHILAIIEATPELRRKFGHDPTSGQQLPHRKNTVSAVKDAGFAGYVEAHEGHHDEIKKSLKPRQQTGVGDFDEDLYEASTPEPHTHERAHYEEHDEYPDSYYERHDEAYLKAKQKKDEAEVPIGHHTGLHNFINAHATNHGLWSKHGEVQDVPLHKPIHATQPYVVDRHVNRYLGKPDDTVDFLKKPEHRQRHKEKPYIGSEMPMFVKHEGNMFAIEGHHRTASALLRGEKHIKGMVWDADKHGMPQEDEDGDAHYGESHSGFQRHAMLIGADCDFHFTDPKAERLHAIDHHDDGVCVASELQRGYKTAAKTALNDEIPWCAHLRQGNCTYPGDKLPDGLVLGIPQDRGPCPWKHSAFQQAACPISAPGPQAVMMVRAAKEGSIEPESDELIRQAALDEDLRFEFTASWADVRNKAKRLRKEGKVRILVASNDGVAGEVQGDHHVYETAITYVPASAKIGYWHCGCRWAAFAWGRSPRYKRFEGRSCSHSLAMQYEAQARGMFGKEIQPDVDRPKWMKQRTPVVIKNDRDGDIDTNWTRRAVPPANMRTTWTGTFPTHGSLAEHEEDGMRPIAALAQDLVEKDFDPGDIMKILKGYGLEHSAAKEILREALTVEAAEQHCPHCGAHIGPHALKEGHCPRCGAPVAKTGMAMPAEPNRTAPSHDGNDRALPYPAQPGAEHIAAEKKQDAPTVSGVCVKAADTQRILMLQRGYDDEKDGARGTWEFPGGHHEDGDLTSLHAGIREWQEEVGQPFPDNGVVHHVWHSPNGVYAGHLVVIPSEKDLSTVDGRVVPNPDDPKGDQHEQCAWWEIEHARKNPALRPECKEHTPWKELAKAGTEKTAGRAGFEDTAFYPDDHEYVQRYPHEYRDHGDYRMHAPSLGFAANSIQATHRTKSGNHEPAGYISWFGGKPRYDGSNIDGGVISKVHVKDQHQRKGLATAMLDWARELHPDKDIRHSTALTDEGKAWSEKTSAVWDQLSSIDPQPSGSGEPPPHSPSKNPASTGFATSEDPASWDELGQVPQHMTPYGAVESVLHEQPEPALPVAYGTEDEDGLMDPPQTDQETMPYGYDDLSEFREDHPEKDPIPDNPIHVAPDTRSEISPVQQSGTPNAFHGSSSEGSVEDIVARFQATAGAKALQASGGHPGADAGPSDNDIAAAAKAHLEKTALKDFTFQEQLELISEGERDGRRARNFGDLKIEGTHFEALQAALDEDDQGLVL